ncbi:GntR family transcriptional regulator [Albimonas sp. CAU 1670]|uniref:GntR family transcriptional regulator n=1 Tax=Albimonas sp. CAU 1670 TaxID=3032599 RepID=UPI0023DCD77E|nr:GntR family transcriptional regulator [Albimonas sp. CAU 1670]MDF2231787.1 GntR family transcriptional regulator [Albimonas sp. CAU 1670]
MSLDHPDIQIEPTETGTEAGQKPAERAYETIRAAILSGELAAGTHLREESLARMTGTSRTPVREALHRLTAEGLALAENRHRYVADFSVHEVAVIFELRARLESYAASLAATRITVEEIDALKAVVARIDALGDASGEGEPERFFELNGRFHDVIIRATRSSQLRALTAQAFALPLVTIKRFVCEQEINVRRSNAQHRDIVTALERRDAEWASAAMMSHIISTKPNALVRGMGA